MYAYMYVMMLCMHYSFALDCAPNHPSPTCRFMIFSGPLHANTVGSIRTYPLLLLPFLIALGNLPPAGSFQGLRILGQPTFDMTPSSAPENFITIGTGLPPVPTHSQLATLSVLLIAQGK